VRFVPGLQGESRKEMLFSAARRSRFLEKEEKKKKRKR